MRIANDLTAVAIGWHVVALVVLVAVVAGWRPRARTVGELAVALIASVALASFVYRSPFNALTFAVLAVILALVVRRVHGRVVPGPAWAQLLGIALIGFGLVYPHFTPWYAAPVGLVPCPTLAVVAGGTLVAGGFGSRAILAGLAIWTAFYAAFGIAVLGVWLDLGLAVATVGLVALWSGRDHGRPL